jgi:AhpD family alkylhydroperoxidase
MNREQIYNEMEHILGLVPGFFKMIPDTSLEMEWELFKSTELEESTIPHKYRELIGIAISGATRCQYCAFYHTEVARLFGASEEEIENASRYAKFSTGWSTYVNSLQVDFDQFKDEVMQMCEHIHASQPVLK